MSKKLIIFGIGELAELVHFYFTHDSDYEVCGFGVDEDYKKTDKFLNLPLVSSKDLPSIFPPDDYVLFIALGYSNLNINRKEKYFYFKDIGYSFANYISSKSQFWKQSISIGENSFIMEGNTIMPFATIGNNVLIWVNNDIAHHMIIKDHVTITSHCAIGGNVVIEEQAFVGLNSTLRNNITIGKSSVIGAGTNVVKNVEQEDLILGNPGKSMKKGAKNVNL